MISVEGYVRGDDYKKLILFVLKNSDAVMLIFRSYGRPFKKRIKEARNIAEAFPNCVSEQS